MARHIFFLGMPRTASTSIQTYLSSLSASNKFLFLGKRGSDFSIPEMWPLLRKRIFLLNDESFYGEYGRGHLRKMIESESEDEHSVLVISDEALSFAGVMNLGLHTVRFAEVLKRLSYLIDGDIEFFMLFRRHMEFVRSFHTCLASLGHFIPLEVFARQIRRSNSNLHDLVAYRDRCRELEEYPNVYISVFEDFITRPLDFLHHKILGFPAPDGAVFPHDNLRPDKHAIHQKLRHLVHLKDTQSQPFPVSLQAWSFGVALETEVSIDESTFFDLSDETTAWLSEMEKQHYDPLCDPAA